MNYLKKISISKTYLAIVNIIFFILLIIPINSEDMNNHFYLINNDEKITLKINGTSNQYILNSEYQYCPDSINLNNQAYNINNNDDCHLIYITGSNMINSVKLIWNNKLADIQTMFKDLKNITEVDLSEFDSSFVQLSNLMFKGCESITSINFDNFNTPLLRNMIGMFYDCFSLKELDLSFFDTSKVTNMSLLFHRCTSLSSVNLNNFNTSEVLSMSYMFFICKSLTTLDLSGFDTSKVSEIKYMFYDCEFLVSLDLSMFNTSATDISAMFYYNIRLSYLNLYNFDTSKVTLMNRTFQNCVSLTYLNISNFDTKEVVNMDFMFFDCEKLSYLDLSHFQTPKLISMNYMFEYCLSLTSLKIPNFTTTQITNMAELFSSCEKLQYLDLSSFDTSNVNQMQFMFSECYSLKSIQLRSFNTKNVFAMLAMFQNCQNLESLDLSSFDTSSVVYLNYMFSQCKSLTSLNLSNFYTPNLRTMAFMFVGCTLLESLDISNLVTSQTTDMQMVFNGCQSLKKLNVSNFDTRNVVYMNHTFEHCTSLTSLDLSNFDTSSVRYMQEMFALSNNLITLNISNFLTQSVINLNFMFHGCNSLEYINFYSYIETQNLKSINNILYNVTNNLVICINENNNIPYLLQAINNKLCPTIYCGDDWKLHQKKIINGVCVEDSEPIETTIVINPETTSKANNELTDIVVTEKIKETSHLNLIITTSITLTTQLKRESIDTTYNKNKQTLDTIIYETTVLSNTNTVSEKILPTLNKIKNYETYQVPLIEKTSILLNPLSTNNYNIYNKNEDTHKSEILSSPSSVFNKMENILKEIKIDYFDNLNYTSKEINQKIYEKIINNVIKNKDVLSEEGIVIEAEDNFFFQITTLENDKERKNNTSKIFSRIDLGECENILKENYNLNENMSLIILKYEKLSNISSERSLQYEIYEPINMNRMNLSLCNDIPIDIYVPLVLSDKLKNLYEELKNLGYDLFDINDDFYQDICTPYRTSNGTDILLSDRINDYYNNNETQCQPNCQFSDYSMETQDLKCECNIISSKIKVEKSEDFSSKSLYKSFYDVLKFSN